MSQMREQNSNPLNGRPSTSTITQNALEKLKACCMRRGVSGIKSFGRMFRIYDDDGNKSLTLEEWKGGLRDYGALGADLNKQEAEMLFKAFDRDGSGTIVFDELLEHIRPPIKESRRNLIDKAFEKLDRSGDGIITSEDLKKAYNPTFHPKYKSGEWSEKQVFKSFLDSYEGRSNDGTRGDGKVTKEEFFNYYVGVSANIDQDVYFDFMMRQAWGL